MTRLTPRLLKPIPAMLRQYDAELEVKTGATLLEVAELAADCTPDISPRLKAASAAVIPITAGQGVIKGFREAVAATLRHIGLTVYAPKGSNIEGLAEAVKKGCDLIFAADDKVFATFNPRKVRVVENSEATGWAYAAALELKAGSLEGKSVSVVGVGRVGSAAVDYLARRRAMCCVFDIALEKAERLKALYPEHVTICKSLQECLKEAGLLILAAPSVNLVPAALVKSDSVVSAPAIPLGLTGGALRKLSMGNLIHDPLQLGVATMAVAALKD